MENIIERASILIQSMEYLRKFSGKTVVVKYGGHAMENEELSYFFAQDIVLMKYVGINPIIVHGGGPQIADMLKTLAIPTKFVNGMRVTDEATMEVVEMVLSGKINKSIVSQISKAGGKAIGLSGRDNSMIKAEKLLTNGEDLGLVGRITSVDAETLKNISDDYIPVIAPVAIGENFEPYNINADIVAGEVAAAMKAEKLLLLTDVDGIQDKNKNRLTTIKLSDVEKLKTDGTLYGGMIPKVDCATTALKAGVTKAHIIDGRVKHSILLEIFTDSGIGTQIIHD